MNSPYRNDPRRHRSSWWPRPTTLVLGAVVAYGVYQWWQSRDDEQQEEENHQGVAMGKGEAPPANTTTTTLRQRKLRCRQETRQAVQDFMASVVVPVVDAETATKAEIQELKALQKTKKKLKQQSVDSHTDEYRQQEEELRRREQELWEAVKIRSVTRVIVLAYAYDILYLVLTVQVHILGGRLLLLQEEEEQEEAAANRASSSPLGVEQHPSRSSVAQSSVGSSTRDRMNAYQQSHSTILQRTFEYFFQEELPTEASQEDAGQKTSSTSGLHLLLTTVQQAVTEVLADWNVVEAGAMNVSLDMWISSIQQIRSRIEDNAPTTENEPSPRRRSSRRRRPRNLLLRFFVPPSAHTQESATEDLHVSSNREENARMVLDETWDLLESPVLMDAQRDCLQATFDILQNEYWGRIFSSSENGHTTKPLAHILAKLKTSSESFGSSNGDRDPYGAALQTIPTVLELGDVSFLDEC